MNRLKQWGTEITPSKYWLNTFLKRTDKDFKFNSKTVCIIFGKKYFYFGENLLVFDNDR